MPGKFAKIKLAKNIDELNLSNGLVKKAPGFIRDWYVEKFVPISIKETSICSTQGYEMVLGGAEEKFILKLGEEARALGVRAMFTSDELLLPQGFYVPEGIFAKVFLLEQVIEKVVRKRKFDPSKLSMVIVAGDEAITKALLTELYAELNHLGVILEVESDTSAYDDIAFDIFDDCGLTVNFGGQGSYLLKEADIIINLSEHGKANEHLYKKEACYVELAPGGDKARRISQRRSDVLLVDRFNVEFAGEHLTLEELELVMYVECAAFSSFVGGRNRDSCHVQVKNWLGLHEPRLRNLNF